DPPAAADLRVEPPAPERPMGPARRALRPRRGARAYPPLPSIRDEPPQRPVALGRALRSTGLHALGGGAERRAAGRQGALRPRPPDRARARAGPRPREEERRAPPVGADAQPPPAQAHRVRGARLGPLHRAGRATDGAHVRAAGGAAV